MIVVVKHEATPLQVRQLAETLECMGLVVQAYLGHGATVLGLLGDTSKVDMERIRCLSMVDSVQRISKPYRMVSRKSHPQPTVVRIGNTAIGGGSLTMIAGPCSVESEDQIFTVAKAVKASGANILRGGAFKPRTSPYMFQGLKAEGLKMLISAGKEVGLPVVSEIMDIATLDLFADVDILQVGARNMQNFNLLQALGRTNKPILLKRGISATLQELLMSAEYLMNEGNDNIILCERGIRSFEPSTRNTLDLSAVPGLHDLSHLPVIVDPSHATGKAKFVPSMALAAAAAGADGIMVEVHNAPSCALCDGAQALTPGEFATLNQKIRALQQVL